MTTPCNICKEPVTDGDYDICELCDEEMIEENPPSVCVYDTNVVYKDRLCKECYDGAIETEDSINSILEEIYTPLCEHCSANVIQGLLCHEHGCPAKYLSERGQISVLYMSIVAIMTSIIAGQSVIFNCLDKLIDVLR